jgi:pimeloyl-ACP methyl ester carboxylesterase
MGRYVQLGAVRTWYEEDGSGPPLVLLHPGGADSRAFEGNLVGLAEWFRVYRPDRRGHGRTPDVAGPISYHQMASDTVAFLEQVVGGPAYLVGHSDGAPVALLTALERPW